MLDELFAVGHIGLKAFRKNQLAAVSIETAPGKNEFCVVVEILEIIVREFSAFPTHSLPAIEQRNAAAS
jgi:hypothetical protein